VSVVVELHLQRLDDPGKDAALAPFAEVVVHRLPRTVSLGQVTPRGAGTEDPERAVEHPAWITWRSAGARRAYGNEGNEQRVLLIAEIVSMHPC
jgi:hypothetical protein